MLPDQGQHVALYTGGGGFTPGTEVITALKAREEIKFDTLIKPTYYASTIVSMSSPT